jgi:hypothetical protein
LNDASPGGVADDLNGVVESQFLEEMRAMGLDCRGTNRKQLSDFLAAATLGD